jgi:RES domain-containing protein
MTAVAEYQQEIGIRPGTFCAYDVAMDGILDLTRPDVLAGCAIDPAARFAPWKTILLVEGKRPPGWDIAERLIAAGASGVLAPSTQVTNGTNLVLWRWNDTPCRRVVALDPQADLPSDREARQPVAPPASNR